MERIERMVSRVLEVIVTACFGLIVVLTVMLVVLRYLFNSSIIGGNEAMEYLFIYTTALGSAVVMGRRDHIGIRYFLNLVPEPAKTILDSLGLALVTLLNLTIALLSRAWILKVGSSESPVLRIPMWSVQMIVPIGCLLAAGYCMILLARNISRLAGGKTAS